MNSCYKHNIVAAIACILSKVVTEQDNYANSIAITPFTSLIQPHISIYDYLQRVFKYSHCSVECLVHALIYIDRLIQSRIIPVTSLTIHRIIITSVVLAIKYFDDSFYTDNQYARIGGIEVEELCFLEIEFLKSINFSLYVSCEDYQKYHNELYLHVSNGLCPCCNTSSLPVLVNSTSDAFDSLYYVCPKVPNDSPRNIMDNLYGN